MRDINQKSQFWRYIVPFTFSIAFAILSGIAILLLGGYDYVDIVESVYIGTVSKDYRIANLISQTSLLLLIGFACAIPFRAGIWNVGGEGQITIGAFISAWIGFGLNGLSQYLHLPIAVLGGMIGGMFWALIPAILKTRFRANEILTTIMMNYIAIYLTDYLANYPFRAPNSPSAETPRILQTAKLENLVPLSTLNSGIFIVIPLIFVVYVLTHHSKFGYESKVVGLNQIFARYGGLRVHNIQLISMMIGGAIAGLLGSILVLGIQGRFIIGIAGGLGYTGALMALMAFNSIVIVILVSLIFAFIQSGMVGLQARLGVPVELSDILESLMIILILTHQSIEKRISNWLARIIYGAKRQL